MIEKEQREFRRIDIQIRGALSYAGEKKVMDVILLNLSVEGVLVKVEHRYPFNRDDQVELVFWLPFLKVHKQESKMIGKKVRFLGIIRRIEQNNEGYLIGIQVRENHIQSLEILEEAWLTLMFENHEKFFFD